MSEEEKSISLKWSKFYSKDDFETITPNISGVYIWGFSIDDKFMPYYVGIASNIDLRLLEHLSNIVSGKYSLFHKDSLKEFSIFKDEKVNINGDSGKIYEPFYSKSIIEFIKHREKLSKHIDFMLNNFNFVFAEVEDLTKLKDVEKKIISTLTLKNLINAREGKPSIVFELKHESDNLEVCNLLINNINYIDNS